MEDLTVETEQAAGPGPVGGAPAESGEVRGPALQWVVVAVLAALVVAVVLATDLISRLDSGQQVLSAARPAFSQASLSADEAGIRALSQDLDTLAPIVTHAAGAAAAGVGLPSTYQHTGEFLQALPLAAASAELPGLETFLGGQLQLSRSDLLTQLGIHSPALAQIVRNLPEVIGGWKDVPGLTAGALHGFSGAPVTTVPGLRDYFAGLVDQMVAQKQNVDGAGQGSSTWVAVLVLLAGLGVFVLALVMLASGRRRRAGERALGGATAVALCGAVVLALVLLSGVSGRLSSQQRFLDGISPAFTASRVQGARDGIRMLQQVVDAQAPMMTADSGAGKEAAGVIAYAAKRTHTSPGAELQALTSRFPHAAALLSAIPLTAVSSELQNGAPTLPPHVAHHLQETFANLPAVISGWRAVPAAVHQLSDNVVRFFATQRASAASLTGPSNVDFSGWLIAVLGAGMLLYGLLMVAIARSRTSAR